MELLAILGLIALGLFECWLHSQRGRTSGYTYSEDSAGYDRPETKGLEAYNTPEFLRDHYQPA